MVQKAFSLILALSILLLGTGGIASAVSENIELTVPQTTLTVSGKATPNALVTIKDGNSIVASINSDSAGNFSTSFTTTSGLHDISIYYTDINSNQSNINKRSISLQPQQVTTTDVFLSPTLTLTSTVYQRGSLIQFRGYTYANSPVTLNIDYGVFSQQTVSNSQGFYEFIIDSSLLTNGAHKATTTSISGLVSSDISNETNFVIEDTEDGNSDGFGPSVPDFVVSPDQLPPPVLETPEDGSTISGDTVTINGNSVPNAQINIYENGKLIGSTFSDESGKWTFEYKATFSPVTLSFEACINGRCSVLSKSITLNFSSIDECKAWFELEMYRYWGVKVDETVKLDILKSSGDGVVVVDWGDGSIEKDENNKNYVKKGESLGSRTSIVFGEEFNHSAQRPKSIAKKYDTAGNYNGKISFRNDDCEQVRYFSVNVINKDSDNSSLRYLWIVIILLLMLSVGHLYLRDQQKTIQKP